MRRIATAAVVLLLLAGCTPTAETAPTASAPGTSQALSTTPPPSPSSSAASTVAATLVINARSVEALNADGDIISTVKVSESGSAVVEKLTKVFGTAPKKTSSGAFRYFDWEGFRLTTRTVTMDGAPTKLHPGIGFVASARSAYGIDIMTAHGISVGDSATTIESDYPGASVVLCDCEDKTFKFDIVTLHTSIDGYKQQQYVLVGAPTAEGTVDSIYAPANNYDS